MLDRLSKLYEIRPRSIVYLFSGGKDSALALLLTRDVVKRYADDTRTRVYILYIAIPGNTHPLNTYAAAYVMEYHRERYGFEPVYRCRDRVFQEYLQRAGLFVDWRNVDMRWCYVEFKYKVIREFTRYIPRPILKIDGMSPRDSKRRAQKIKDEFEYVEPSDEAPYWAWHPLYSFDGDPLEVLQRYPEFEPVVMLYRLFGDSLNCVVCPFKKLSKYAKYDEVEDMGIISMYMDLVLKSKRAKKIFERFNTVKLTKFMSSG